jgi:hypothetical protein
MRLKRGFAPVNGPSFEEGACREASEKPSGTPDEARN